MARFAYKKNKNRGNAPGPLIFYGQKRSSRSKLRLIDYDAKNLQETELKMVDEVGSFKETKSVTWINIDGLHNVKQVEKIGKEFDLHSLTIEDILHTDQRPKLEEHDNYIFIIIKMLKYNDKKNKVDSEQLSMVIGENYLITFQEKIGDYFDPVREKIRKGKGRVRGAGSDYLAYSLIDIVIDNYLYIVEKIGEKVEDIEDKILSAKTQNILVTLNQNKKEFNYLRKNIRPAKEMISHLARLDCNLINESTMPFLKDLEELALQTTEAIDTYREMLTDQLNIYNSDTSNKMTEVMKILTIFSAIFIPLTFIAGVYGTNFKHFPGISHEYGFHIFILTLLVLGLLMVRFFKKKNWF